MAALGGIWLRRWLMTRWRRRLVGGNLPGTRYTNWTAVIEKLGFGLAIYALSHGDTSIVPAWDNQFAVTT